MTNERELLQWLKYGLVPLITKENGMVSSYNKGVGGIQILQKRFERDTCTTGTVQNLLVYPK